MLLKLSSKVKLGGLLSKLKMIGNSTCIVCLYLPRPADYGISRCGAVALSNLEGTPRPDFKIKQYAISTPFPYIVINRPVERLKDANCFSS